MSPKSVRREENWEVSVDYLLLKLYHTHPKLFIYHILLLFTYKIQEIASLTS